MAAFEAGAETPGHLQQPVGFQAQGEEGDVGRHDPGRGAAALQQGLGVLQPKRPVPALQLGIVAVGGGPQDGLFEQVQPQGEDRGAGVLLAPAAGGAGVDAVAAAAVDHPAVLDHAAFGKDDDLVALEDLPGQQRQQPGMVVGHGAGGAQQLCQVGVDFEQLAVGDGITVSPAMLVEQVLGNQGLEAGEMIENEDLALPDVVVGIVKLDVQAQKAPGEAEQADRAVVEAGVDVEISGRFGPGRHVHRMSSAAGGISVCSLAAAKASTGKEEGGPAGPPSLAPKRPERLSRAGPP
ncbi:hypothetical protein MIT9_P0279 [Methylomarinovum caldicuralii]|uniref:Uncharacterized protein n=1 Tax=Methylomarinovum caldicuralii TaxID=438856 RepID=A0AAU9BPR4_9GAMM|nr:hypothetical protein [Methylomarinovum caldicuralii]BCX80703.1 hypothetical protein MIT9_P0279 [Methylomarinovum caldicuralii]